MDKEKVIKGLEICTTRPCYCTGCPYIKECCLDSQELMEDALALLKEQRAVKPRVSSVEQRCGNCNKVIEMDGWKACPWCGKPILWETVGRTVK